MDTTLLADIERCLGKADAAGETLVAACLSSAIDTLRQSMDDGSGGRGVVVGIYRGARDRTRFN